ncbi:syntaxin-11-like [Brachionichthys hirsutus]|uniref:syntaxin-11-like n=1 Tax=Brachionichthys hirsutus TaxID=412623 RepID=UPI0036043654
MRDMLERLKAMEEEEEEEEEGEEEEDPPQSQGSGPEVDGDLAPSQQAVVFENSTAIDGVLREAHAVRREISALRLEVERLSAHNRRFGTSTRRLTLLKKDSESIAKGVRHRGEALYARLHALGVEEREGPASAAGRIARLQHATLTRALHAAMADYNEAEELQRSTCRERIQRQASIVGTEITDEQLDALVHAGGGGWAELSQSLQTRGARSSRWAMCEIKGRHRELVELEARMKEVQQLFLQLAVMVEDQGSFINSIEANVNAADQYVETVNVHIKKALRYKKRNPFLQCCSCLRANE